jgi:hypothetical protein
MGRKETLLGEGLRSLKGLINSKVDQFTDESICILNFRSANFAAFCE